MTIPVLDNHHIGFFTGPGGGGGFWTGPVSGPANEALLATLYDCVTTFSLMGIPLMNVNLVTASQKHDTNDADGLDLTALWVAMQRDGVFGPDSLEMDLTFTGKDGRRHATGRLPHQTDHWPIARGLDILAGRGLDPDTMVGLDAEIFLSDTYSETLNATDELRHHRARVAKARLMAEVSTRHGVDPLVLNNLLLFGFHKSNPARALLAPVVSTDGDFFKQLFPLIYNQEIVWAYDQEESHGDSTRRVKGRPTMTHKGIERYGVAVWDMLSHSPDHAGRVGTVADFVNHLHATAA